jgi:hypothetical protein
MESIMDKLIKNYSNKNKLSKDMVKEYLFILMEIGILETIFKDKYFKKLIFFFLQYYKKKFN